MKYEKHVMMRRPRFPAVTERPGGSVGGLGSRARRRRDRRERSSGEGRALVCKAKRAPLTGGWRPDGCAYADAGPMSKRAVRMGGDLHAGDSLDRNPASCCRSRPNPWDETQLDVLSANSGPSTYSHQDRRKRGGKAAGAPSGPAYTVGGGRPIGPRKGSVPSCRRERGSASWVGRDVPRM